MFSFFGGGSSKPRDDQPPAARPPPESIYDMTIGAAQAGGAGSGAGGAGQRGGASNQQQQQQQQQQAQSLLNFDPTGLERAAKAAKDLDTSRNAKQAVEIALSQEQTKQLERQIHLKEVDAQVKSLEINRIQKEQEERRKTIEMETSHINHRNKQQDEMARRRNQEQMEAQRKLQEEQLRKQEESITRQEMMKRQTVEYEKELQRKNDKAKVEAEIEAKIKYERENRELHLENMKLQASELRDTTIQAIKVAGETIGNGVKEFLGDKERLTAAVASITVLALGIYAARTSTGVIGKYVESKMGKPSLVRDTSRKTVVTMLRNPLKTLKQWRKTVEDKDLLGDVVLNTNLAERMRSIAWTSINSQRNRAPFRNLLLHGPPGTGKTMFAKNLALNSGMDYAIMTGADVAPLGKEAVTEIHKLFDWAAKSQKGLVLFIDEADAFLRRRNKEVIGEEMRNCLNAFLYRTGESSKKFMIILASNQPEQLDWAINDRVDEVVEFGLPGLEERERIIEQNFNRYILNHHQETGAKAIHVLGIANDELRKVAKLTEHFSGRELSKLVIGWQAAAFGSIDNTLTHEMMFKVLKTHTAQHERKVHWQKT